MFKYWKGLFLFTGKVISKPTAESKNIHKTGHWTEIQFHLIRL